MAFYDGDPEEVSSTLLGTAQTTVSLAPGQYEDVSITLPDTTIALPVWAAADDDGSVAGEVTGQHNELDEVNNVYQSRVYLAGATNLAPVVDAGADLTITLPDTAIVTGTVTDDELPIDTLTYSWSQVDGPDTVVFENASSLSTEVTFTTEGVYTLRLTADDAELTGSDELTITVEENPVVLPPEPTSPEAPPIQVPGFIFSPDNQSILSEPTPIVLADNTPLTDVTVDYWPVNDPNAYQILAMYEQVTGGETLATFDTTILANGSYVIRVTGTDASEELVCQRDHGDSRG